MKVINAIDLVVEVDGEGLSVQTLVAHAASETTRMVSVAHGLEDHLHDQVAANAAFLRGLLETRILETY